MHRGLDGDGRRVHRVLRYGMQIIRPARACDHARIAPLRVLRRYPASLPGEAGSSIDRPLLPRRSHLPPCAAQSCVRHKELKVGIVDLIGRNAARRGRRMRATRCVNKNHVARDVAGGTACTCRRGFSFLIRGCDGQGRLVSSARAVSRLLPHVTRGKPTGSRGTCTELRCV